MVHACAKTSLNVGLPSFGTAGTLTKLCPPTVAGLIQHGRGVLGPRVGYLASNAAARHDGERLSGLIVGRRAGQPRAFRPPGARRQPVSGRCSPGPRRPHPTGRDRPAARWAARWTAPSIVVRTAVPACPGQLFSTADPAARRVLHDHLGGRRSGQRCLVGLLEAGQADRGPWPVRVAVLDKFPGGLGSHLAGNGGHGAAEQPRGHHLVRQVRHFPQRRTEPGERARSQLDEFQERVRRGGEDLADHLVGLRAGQPGHLGQFRGCHDRVGNPAWPDSDLDRGRSQDQGPAAESSSGLRAGTVVRTASRSPGPRPGTITDGDQTTSQPAPCRRSRK